MEQEAEANAPEFLLSTCCGFPLSEPQSFSCLLVKPHMHEAKLLLHYRLLWTGLRMDKGTFISSTVHCYGSLLQWQPCVGVQCMYRCACECLMRVWRNIYKIYSTRLVVSHWFLTIYNPSRLITPSRGTMHKQSLETQQKKGPVLHWLI